MLTIILVAVFLPSVLGIGCCTPDKLTGTIYGKDGGVRFAVDFSQGKYYSKPLNNATGEQFTLVDFNTKTKYIQYNSGCVKSAALPSDLYTKCIPSDATKLGSSYIGDQASGVTTSGYGFSGDGYQYSVTMTDAKCLPISFVISKSGGAAEDTLLFFGLNQSLDDLTKLNPDVSKCTENSVVG